MRILILVIYVLILIVNVNLNAQDIPWRQLDSKRNQDYGHPILNDIESHMPSSHIYRDSDRVTWAHETTHGLNSIIRLKFSSTYSNIRINALYCLNNYFVLFPEPYIRKRDIIPNILPDLRNNHLFNLYIAGQTEWDDTPLYVLDEWISYTNGSFVGDRPDTITNMLIFNFYATALFVTISKQDKEYPDMVYLRNFILWNVNRSFTLVRNEEHQRLKDLWITTYGNPKI